jgi:hypothetical protein
MKIRGKPPQRVMTPPCGNSSCNLCILNNYRNNYTSKTRYNCSRDGVFVLVRARLLVTHRPTAKIGWTPTHMWLIVA